MAARAVSSGTICFGLVSIPIKLYTAASAKSVSFNMLHNQCGGRLKQQYICPTENVVVERTATVKGYEFARDQYVRFSEEELKALESPKTDSLELVAFVPESTVDFVYLEKMYYVGPDKGGDRAYRLLSQAMKRANRIAVGRYWTRGKEQLVLVRPYKRGLSLHYVYYADEVRSFDEIELGSETAYKDIELELADKLIEQLAEPAFSPEKYRDEYRERVLVAVDQKVKGEEVTQASSEPQAQIIDLLEALKQSVARAKPAAEATEVPVDAPLQAKPPKKAVPKEGAATDKKKTA